MEFSDAYKALRQGCRIKLPEWSGYWKWEEDSIKMHLKTGSVMDIRETEDVNYTFQFIIRNDWIIDRDDPEEFTEELNINTLTFGEALRYLKLGYSLARLKWDDNVRITKNTQIPSSIIHKYITANKLIPAIMVHKYIRDEWMCCGEFALSYEDIFSEDWYIVTE